MALLTQTQITFLEGKLKSLKENRENLTVTLNAELNAFKLSSGDLVSASTMGLRESISAIDKEIETITTLLKSAQVPEYDAEKIAIGTNFSVAIDINGKIKENKYTLVETNPRLNNEDGYAHISVESPLGKAVLGKKVNDPFVYYAPAGTFNGVVTSIEPKKVNSEEKSVARQKSIGTHPSMKKGK